jgi:DNA primase
LRGAQRYSDYLIERARTEFPGRTADTKTKQMNFLLPHIRRMPNALARAEFADDAIQKLNIDSTIFRQELKQAAAQRLGSVRSHRHEPANEIERILLRALVLPERDSARQAAAPALAEHPEWYDGMNAAPLFDALAHAPAPGNPLDSAPDDATRAMLAEVLASQPDPDAALPAQRGSPLLDLAAQVEEALRSLEQRHLERRQRELRSAIAEAERRGDHAMVHTLTLEKMRLDRALREL